MPAFLRPSLPFHSQSGGASLMPLAAYARSSSLRRSSIGKSNSGCSRSSLTSLAEMWSASRWASDSGASAPRVLPKPIVRSSMLRENTHAKR